MFLQSLESTERNKSLSPSAPQAILPLCLLLQESSPMNFLWRWKAGGEWRNTGRHGWMASLTQWTWVWAGSGKWWWTGKPGVLQSMGSKRVGHDWATELNWDVVRGWLSLSALMLWAQGWCEGKEQCLILTGSSVEAWNTNSKFLQLHKKRGAPPSVSPRPLDRDSLAA